MGKKTQSWAWKFHGEKQPFVSNHQFSNIIDTEWPTSSGSFCATDTSCSELLLEIEGTLVGASENTSFDGSESWRQHRQIDPSVVGWSGISQESFRKTMDSVPRQWNRESSLYIFIYFCSLTEAILPVFLSFFFCRYKNTEISHFTQMYYKRYLQWK